MSWPAGVDLIVLDEVDSTMAEAARRLPELAGPTWIMARRQTAGRGTRGRRWIDPVDNLAATLVMRPEGPPAEAALRSFVAALALREAVLAYAPAADVALKWPNDVLLTGGKLAGILLESVSGGTALMVGVGVNLRHVPEAIESSAFAPVALQRSAGFPVAPEEFLGTLAGAFARWENRLRQEGFGPLRTEWLRHAARLGTEISARIGADLVHGCFETIDAAGHLVLSTKDGRRVVPAAEVFF